MLQFKKLILASLMFTLVGVASQGWVGEGAPIAAPSGLALGIDLSSYSLISGHYINYLDDNLFMHLFMGVDNRSGMLFGVNQLDIKPFLGFTFGWHLPWSWIGWEFMPGVQLFRISPIEVGVEIRQGQEGMIQLNPVLMLNILTAKIKI